MPNHYDDIREEREGKNQLDEMKDMKYEIDIFMNAASYEETRALYKVMQILDNPPSMEDIIINFTSSILNLS